MSASLQIPERAQPPGCDLCGRGWRSDVPPTRVHRGSHSYFTCWPCSVKIVKHTTDRNSIQVMEESNA